MNQTGAPKTIRLKSAPRAAAQNPLAQPGEQLALALDVGGAAVPAGLGEGQSKNSGSIRSAVRRKRDEAPDGITGSESAIGSDDLASADTASDSYGAALGPFAQATGSGSAPANDAAAASAGSASGGGAGAAAGAITATEFAAMLPAALAFGAGVLVLNESTSSSSAIATANQAPTSTPIQAATTSEGVAASINVNVFTDPEGGPLTYAIKVTKKVGNGFVDYAAPWLTVDPATRKVVGTPPEGEEGEYEVTVTATDGGKLSKSEKFSFTVLNGDAPVVIDGYLRGALVYRDVNGDGVWNHDPITSVVVTETAGTYSLVINGGTFQSSEPWGITDQFGKAPAIGGGTGDVRTEPWTYGGKINGTATDLVTLDISTLREWSGSYVAPSRSGVINPISTLIAAAKTELGGDVAAAQARVKTVLGLPEGGADLLNFDPLAEASKAGTFAAAQEALTIQGKALQVANLLRIVAEVANSAGVANLGQVAQVVARSLVANNVAFNLGSEAALSSVVSGLKDYVSADAAKGIDAAVSTVSKAVAFLNSSIQNAVSAAVAGAGGNLSNLDIGGALSEAIQNQIVAQDLVASSLANAIAVAVSTGGNAGLIAAALNDISGLAAGDAAALSRARILTRASVGSVFVSSADTNAASAIDDNVYVLASRVGETTAATGGAVGNALRNDLVPRGFTTDVVSGRAGDEVTTIGSYTAFNGTATELTLTGVYGTLKLERLSNSDNGKFTYTVTTWPGADVVVEDVFSYRLQAVGSGTLSDDARFDFGTIRVAVSTINFPPVVDLLQGELTERGTANPLALGTVSFNLLDAGRDPEGGALTLSSVSYRTQSGTVVSLNLGAAGQGVDGEFGRLARVGSTNEFLYTLDQDKADYLGSGQTAVDVFNFELSDAAGKATKSSIVVTIRGSDDPALTVNVPPTSSDGVAFISEDSSYRFDVSDFTFRDRNADQTLSKVKIDALPTGGTLTFAGEPVAAGAEIAVSDLGSTAGKLVFTPSANLNGNGAASFKFKVVDSGATPLASVLANTFAFDITAVNDAPVASGSATLSAINEDTASPTGALVSTLFGESFSDAADGVAGGSTANTLAGVAVSSHTADAAKGKWQYSSNGEQWTDLGNVSAATAAISLKATDSLRFLPAANFNGAAPALSAKLIDSSGTAITTGGTVDASGGAATAFSSTAVALSHTISAVNDAPVNTVPSAQTVNEDTNLSISGLSVADVDAGAGNVTVTLGVTQGTITVAASNGVTVGTNATNSVSLTGTVANINAALSATNGVVYRGALNYVGSDTLTVTTSDGGSTGVGGALSDTDTVSITISAVNDAPVFSASAPRLLSKPEFVAGSAAPPVHDVLLKLSEFVSDVDSSGEVLRYSISGGLDAADFTIDELTGEIKFQRSQSESISFESPRDSDGNNIYLITVRVWDGVNETLLDLEFTVTNEDELGAVIITRNGEPLAANVAPKQGDILVAVLDEPDDEVDSTEVVQWFADGIAIQGAISPSLTLTESLIGRVISAKITYDDFGSFDSGALDSVTSAATLPVLPRNTAPQLSGVSLTPLTYTLGAAELSVPVSSRFTDADADTLSYRLSDSTGAALPVGLSIGIANGDASIVGSPTAGFIGSRTLLVTATDPSGASVTDSVTLTVNAPSAKSGLYLTQRSAQMTDFGPTEGATAGTAFKAATGTNISAGRVSVAFSSTTDGVGIGADLSRENLLQLLDSNAGTGAVPYVSLPVVSTLANGIQTTGRMALKLSLDGLPEVSVDLAVRVETSTVTVNNTATQRTVFKVNGDQSPNSLASFKDGVELASATGSTLDLYLLRLLDQGLTASAKSLLSQVISDDLNATFSVSFTDLPIYGPSGEALKGIDTSVSIDDTPNRAPALAVPHQNGSMLGVQLPLGSTVALGGLLADLDSAGGLFADSISDPNNGDTLYFMVGQPTSGSLVWKGDVITFPAADGSVGGNFKLIGSTVRLKVSASEIDKLEYRANPSVAVAPGTIPADELASLAISVVDSSGAMSLTAPVGLKILGATVPNVFGLVGGDLTLVDAGLGVAGRVVAVGPASVMSVPSNGELFKVTQSGSGLTKLGSALKAGDSILSTDLVAFEPADVFGSSTPARDDLVLRQSNTDGVGFSRIDFSLAVAASDSIPTAINLSNAKSSVPEGVTSIKTAVAQVEVSGSSTVNYSLGGSDKDSFTLETVSGVTTLYFNAGITPDFEVRQKYDVRVNADNPNVGLAGSVEAVRDFTLAVENRLDTLELKSNTVTLTDYDASGAAWSARSVVGALSTSNGVNTLSFDGVAAKASFSRANLLKLFDTTVGNGKAPSLSFELDLASPNAIPSGTAQINVTLEARSKALGTALPMTVTFPVTVDVISSSSGVSISLPAQTTNMSLSVGGMSLGSLTLGNLDSDLFSLSSSGSTSTPSALSIKLDNLFAKAEADKVPLASLGQGGAVGVAGAVAAAALGDKSLADLVNLARDVTTLSPEVADTPLGRIIDILQDTITVPSGLGSMKFSEALRLGAKLVLPDNLGAATLGEAVGLGFKILDLPQSLSTAGDLLKVMRDAIDLPPSLEGTLGALRLQLATNSTESMLLDKVETLVRALMAPGAESYTGSLADKTIPQLIDLAVSSGLGSVKLSEISSEVDKSFGGYSVPQMLSLASDIAENLYGSMSLSTMLQKANSVITLPASSSDLGAKSLSELLDIAQTLVVLGDLLQGGAGELAALTGGTTTVAGLVNLVQSAVTVDGQISGRSLANLLDLMDTTFKVGDALGTGNSLSELINDLRNDVVDLDTMVHLASRAAFSDDGELRVSVDLPSNLVLLSAEDKVVNSLDFKALLSASQPIL